MNPIRIEQLNATLPANGPKTQSKSETGFGEVLSGAIKSVDGQEKAADKSVLDMLEGKRDIPETMIALQKADISMRLFLKVRNKMMDAYREIMHMQY